VLMRTPFRRCTYVSGSGGRATVEADDFNKRFLLVQISPHQPLLPEAGLMRPFKPLVGPPSLWSPYMLDGSRGRDRCILSSIIILLIE
jgi:hypothetical protein